MLQPAENAAADLAHCRAAIHRHSRSFYAASRLLPARVRDAAVATYAFCRAADDAVDEAGSAIDARIRHAAVLRRLDRIYRGEPVDTASGRAFALVVAAARIPREEPEALLAGMAQDLGPVRIADEDALLLYCYRAAGVVGRMMSRIMGRSDAAALGRAAHLGIAMQLTNIARDVGEDTTRDRIYLPSGWLAEAGGSETEVLAARATPAVRRVTLRVLGLAELYYDSGIAGIGMLPASCRPAILSAALLYRAIGRRVAARDGDGVTERARVSGIGKAGLIAVAAVRCAIDPRLRRRTTRPDASHLDASLRRTGVLP
ncbi:MAG TPA: phytoene/squalene synthase family protein [Candidatus Eisenbacteria bacterium]|nr:phytoene/squalene synthase family protein [Candidatus Eisenbacteria bacterium]